MSTVTSMTDEEFHLLAHLLNQYVGQHINYPHETEDDFLNWVDCNTGVHEDYPFDIENYDANFFAHAANELGSGHPLSQGDFFKDLCQLRHVLIKFMNQYS